MSLTIGQFNESFPPAIDGVANVVMNYACWMNRKYGRCVVVTPEYPQAHDDYEFEVYRYSSVKVPTRNEYRVGLPQMDAPIWHDLKKIPFDIVHAHSPFGAGLAARMLARKMEIPIVATFHSKYRDDFKESIKSDMIVENVVSRIVEFYESVDEVWSVNDGCAETLRQYGYRGDIRVMDNATDLPPRSPSEEASRAVEAMTGIGADVPLLIFVGQHIWQKNVRMIIEAMALLKQRGCRFRMLFVGDGPKKAEMKRMVQALGIGDVVSFAGKVQDRDTLAAIYLRSSALLFPSLYDMSSLVPREAAACGCPTVFAKGSTTAQGITEGNGFLIDNSPKSLADAAEHILCNPEHARAVGEEARRTLYVGWEDAVQAVYDRYLYLIDWKRTMSAGQDR
jgi:glycosyltransferase involved in cell wall biosynthesis